ncbi:MAG: serine hydrolase domain-containing protein, partial [Thermomicrobiales bacterium]
MTVETPTSLVEHHDVPGATLALSSADGTVTRSIGWRDQERTTPLDALARFPIYSITKPMVATIILQLVEAHAFALDDPLRDLVGTHAPWLDPAITVRQT